MHYFKRNIGDYHKKAGRLSMIEHGAYTLLLDACYDRERFPTLAEAIDWCWARSAEEVAAVGFVLCKFFTLDGDKYVQARIQDEINSYHAMALKNKEIAEKREEDKRTKREKNSTKREPAVNEPAPNQEPRTTNQEPLKESKDQSGAKAPSQKKTASVLDHAFLIDQGATEQHAADWLKSRKSPLTKTAWDAVVREAAKAGITPAAAVQVCAENSWRGFRADWYANSGAGNGSQNQASQRVDNSAVGQVKRAIAEREAADREASATTHGQAGAENVRDIRPPLDGEFRRVV
jgi:uncharacterized protein YdaU (DUF1376 family)